MAENLETLSKFVQQYPQKRDERLEYAFVGGTAVRLLQEVMHYRGLKRPITDFDLINFGEGQYPVHTINPQIVLGLFSADPQDYVQRTNVGNRDYYSMNGSFLALTKTCALDTPREKDYSDVSFLYDYNQVNQKQLKDLFRRTRTLTKDSELALDTFNWILSDKKDSVKPRLFQTFPRLVNLCNEFEDQETARDIVKDCIEADHFRRGYDLSSIIYGVHSVLREIPTDDDEERIKIMIKLFDISRSGDYSDFDRLVHFKILPGVRYSGRRGPDALEYALGNLQ